MKDRGSMLRLPLLEGSYKAVPGSSPVVPLFSVSAPPSSNFEGVLCFSVAVKFTFSDTF